VSRSSYNFADVYILYAVCIQTAYWILCDPKRSPPDEAWEACRVRRCNILH